MCMKNKLHLFPNHHISVNLFFTKREWGQSCHICYFMSGMCKFICKLLVIIQSINNTIPRDERFSNNNMTNTVLHTNTYFKPSLLLPSTHSIFLYKYWQQGKVLLTIFNNIYQLFNFSAFEWDRTLYCRYIYMYNTLAQE